MQVLAQSLSEVYTSDYFVDLVAEVADLEKRASLERLVASFLSSWYSTGSAEQWMDTSAVGQQVKGCLSRFVTFCKCFAVLLRVDHPSWNLSALDVTAVTDKSVRDTFLKVMRGILTTQLSDASNQSSAKAASREFWMAEVVDVMKTAATHGPALESIQTYMKELPNEEDNDDDNTSIVLSPGCTSALESMIGDLPDLKVKMRKGSTVMLQKALKRRLLQLATSILKETGTNISSADLNTVMGGLLGCRETRET